MEHSALNLDDVQLFIEVVRAKSFSGAGRKLALPKSTVSRRISELEDGLGTRLLERTTRSLRLTELGTSFYERAAHHIDELRDASRALSEQDDKPRGLLKVSAPSDSRISEAILRYQRRYPKVSVVLYGAAHRVDLIAEDFDLAIRAGDLPDSSLIARHIRGSRRWLVASPLYLSTASVVKELADLAKHDCLLHSSRSNSETWFFDTAEGVKKVEVRGPFATNSMENLTHAAVLGHGIAFLPDAACDRVLQSGQLVRLLPHYQSPAVPLSIVFPSSRMMTPKLRSFIDFMELELKT